MPWTTLEQLWNRTINPQTGNTSSEESWNKEVETLYRMGIGMEEAIRYLYQEQPDFESFKIWINERKTDTETVSAADIPDVLSLEDLAFWQENGYVIIKDAISKEDCKATQQAIWEFLEMNPDDRESWYKRHEEQRGLMLNFHNHETLNRNRLSPRIQKAYEQLYKTTKIYKTIDKVSFNPPETNNFKFLGSPLHWDVSLKQPIPFGLQGLLYLTDCDPNDGAFHCVPGFHTKIDSWLNGLEPHINPREEALATLQPVPVVAKAGDFIIWQNTLPHCASPNHGNVPRMVQYLTYFPDDFKSAEEWI